MNPFKYLNRIGSIECVSLEVKEVSKTSTFKTANVIQYTWFGQTSRQIYCICDSDRYLCEQWCDAEGIELNEPEYRWAINKYTTMLEADVDRLNTKAEIAKFRLF